MASSEKHPPANLPPRSERGEDQRLALRRISQRLKRLQAEFDRINHPGTREAGQS